MLRGAFLGRPECSAARMDEIDEIEIEIRLKSLLNDIDHLDVPGYNEGVPKGTQARLVNLTFGAVYVDAPGELDLEYVQA